MKKNRLMRFAAVLLVLTLMTSCFVGGTFAKYVTTDSATDTARVAKWGIEVLASGNLFGTDYKANSAGTDPNEDEIITASTSVDSSDSADVVAPGTRNTNGFTVAITGTPEVSYSVSAKTGKATAADKYNEDIFLGEGTWGVMVKATGLNNDSSVIGLYKYDSIAKTYSEVTGEETVVGDYYELHDVTTVAAGGYYPIVWTVVKDGGTVDITTVGRHLPAIADDMVTNLANAKMTTINYGFANVPATASYKLTWVWPFEVDAESNEADTILGNLMSGEADGDVVLLNASTNKYVQPAEQDGDTLNNYNLDIVFNFEVTVEQTD